MSRLSFPKKSFTLLCLIISLTLTVKAETEISQIAVGGTGDDGVSNFLPTINGYIFGGNTYSNAVGGRDALIFESDSNGTPTWSTTFGGNSNESIVGIALLPDAGYAVTGRTNSYGYSDTDLFFARIDAQGGVTHFKTYGGYYEDRSMGIIPTQDGQFLIFGATRNGTISGGTVQDVLLLKVSQFGDVIWSRAYGGIISEVAYSAKETAEGDFIVFAYGDSFENQQVSTDMYILKINKNGDIIWTTCYGGAGYEMITASSAGYIAPTGDFYVMGATTSYGAGDYDQILMKFNSQGVLQWTRTLGGTGYDYGRGVMVTSYGAVLAWGFITDPGNGSLDGMVTKFTPDGVTLWSKVYGSDNADDIYRIKEIGGDSLLMVGMTQSYGNGGKDIWLITTDQDGNADCNLSEFQPTISPQSVPLTTTGAYKGAVNLEISDIDVNILSVNHTPFLEVDTVCTTTGTSSIDLGLTPDSFYLSANSPNPFNPETTIHFDLPEASVTSLSIFNVKGQWVQDLVANEELPPGYYSKQWDGKNHLGREMPSGVYFYRLQAGNFTQKQEMLLLK